MQLPATAPLPTCLTKSTLSEVSGSSSATASLRPLPAHASPTAMAAPYLCQHTTHANMATVTTKQ